MKQSDNIHGGGTRRLVLVVEDNDINRHILCSLLETEFDVIQAKNGEEGFRLLEEHYRELAIILLDLFMPVCDGFDFMRRKRLDKRYDTVPVFVVTTSEELSDEILCLELGANDFVVKPYNFEIMMNRIHNMIKLRESAALVNQLAVDAVTGLHCKEFFGRTVEDVFAANADASFDMVCSDIANFKLLNDRYGERNCDRLLHDLATALKEAMPDCIAAGRTGGDTFAFLIEHRERGWENVLVSAVAKLPYANLDVRFGIVEDVDHSMTASQICYRAMSTIDTVRDLHGNVVAYYDDDTHQRQLMEQAIRENMKTALEEFQFSVFYQPKYDVRAEKTGGAEALVRWFHPTLGSISPGLFISVFERNGFITELDMFVWEEACREVKRCIELGLPVLPISVNASRLDFDVPDLPDRLVELADKHGVDHSLLHVELTETAYIDNPEAVTRTLYRLREMGFSTELDDFGAGYSSLVSLNTLPLDVMKLDMSMVQQATRLNDFRIVESTIRLAQTLGLKTVIEGVETADEAERVRAIGCDYIQGYYYSRPLSRDDFEQYLKREQEKHS
ncbi:MAG: EAL domain-containing protein [Atopobiaceae bacterium]|nr:EAL domain-containing protein [Atopobiaceae bacterium]